MLSLALCTSLLASRAHAQSSAATSAEPLIFPRLMVAYGVGTTGGHDDVLAGTMLQTVAVRFLVGRHFAIDGDVSFSNSTWNTS